MQSGDVREFMGKRAMVAAFGIWAVKDKKGYIHIHLTGDKENFRHVTICNKPDSKRYNMAFFDNLKKLLLAHNKWPFKG